MFGATRLDRRLFGATGQNHRMLGATTLDHQRCAASWSGLFGPDPVHDLPDLGTFQPLDQPGAGLDHITGLRRIGVHPDFDFQLVNDTALAMGQAVISESDGHGDRRTCPGQRIDPDTATYVGQRRAKMNVHD